MKTSVAGLLLLGSRLLLPDSARANELPDAELTFFNVHTNERLRVRYRDDAGKYDLTALDDVNHIMRCHHTGEVAAMDVQLLEHVNLVHKAVDGAGEIHVVSGYRSPEYNAQLVKRSRRVAQHSLHVQGQALDFYIPGVKLREIRHAALRLQGRDFFDRAIFSLNWLR
ncbi:MAG TPA: DUF882 domain-containing protein, partial [Nitrospiraceae bacterium]|nr:DUF882 domain-containing protein [Nitrospiraceae bacterium]